MQNEQDFIKGAFQSGLNPQQVSQAVRVYRQKQPQRGMIGGIVKGVTQPFVNTAKNIGGAGYEVYRAGKSALGDKNAYVNQDSGDVVQNPFLNEEELTKVSQPLSLQKGSALRQQIGDSANIASYAVPFGKGANIATKALLPGAAVGAMNSATADASLGDIGMGALGGTAFAGATYGAGKFLKKAPNAMRNKSEDVITRGLGNPAKQAKLEQKGGRSIGSFLKQYDILDRSPETAGEVKKAIINQYDDLALKSGKTVPTGKVISRIDSELASLQGGAGKFSDANQSKIEELLRRKEQFLQSVGADATQSPLNTSIKDATLFRREAIDPDIPQSMFNLDAKGSGKAQGAKAMRDILRGTINSSDDRLKQLGLDYGMAKGVEDILTKAQSRVNNRSLISVFKLGSAGVGGMIGGAPGAIGGYLMEQVVNHPAFIKVLSNVLSSGATGQEAVNQILARPEVQQLVLQLASRAGSGASRLGQRELQTNQLEVSPQRQQENPYSPIINPPVKPAYNFKQKVIKRPKNVFSKEQGGGNPFGGMVKKVQDWQAQNRANVSKVNVPDVPQSFVQGAITGAAGFTGLDKKIPIGHEYTPKTNAGKVASVVGSGVGYAAGAGRYIAPAEKFVQGAMNVPKVVKSAPLITKAANVFAQKVVPPVATQMISSAPGAALDSAMNKEKFLPTYAKSVAGGLAGRAIGAGAGAVAKKVTSLMPRQNAFRVPEKTGIEGVLQRGFDLERNFVSATENGNIQPRNVGKYAQKLKLQTSAGGDPTTLFNKEIPLLLVQIPGKIGALKMAPSQIAANTNLMKYITGPANESARALFR